MRVVWILNIFVICMIQFGSTGYVGLTGTANNLYTAANEIEPTLRSAANEIQKVLATNAHPDGSIDEINEQKQIPALATQGIDVAQAIEKAVKYLEQNVNARVGTSRSASKNYYVSDDVIEQISVYLNQISDKLGNVVSDLKRIRSKFEKYNNPVINSLEIQTVPDNLTKKILTIFNDAALYIRNIGFTLQSISAYLEEYESISTDQSSNPYIIIINSIAKVFANVADDITKHMHEYSNAVKYKQLSHSVELINAHTEYTEFNILLQYLENEANTAANFLDAGKKVLNDFFT